MDFTLVGNNINYKVYNNRADFKEHVEFIASNSNTFYRSDHQLAKTATKVRGVVERFLYLEKHFDGSVINVETIMHCCC